MPLNDEWIKTVLMVTGYFENSSDPLGAVSGDFDEMGISLGVLQWNIGSESLQPLVRNIGRAKVVATMPVYGSDLWTACTSGIPHGLIVVRGWQNGSRLQPAVAKELKAFVRSAPFIEQQVAAAHHVAERAWSNATTWNAAYGKGEPSLQDFCWFFDLHTQNGGLNDVTPASVTRIRVFQAVVSS